MYDYSKLERKVKIISKKASIYLGSFLSKEEIEKEVFKAYEYAKRAHE